MTREPLMTVDWPVDLDDIAVHVELDADLKADVAIIGGGLGAIAAAIAAADSGARVVMTAEEPVIGGQVTAQLTSPLDEHALVESAGVTASYRRFRNRIRGLAGDDNPGGGWVSRLCFEPMLGLRVLEEMLATHIASGLIHVVTDAHPVIAFDDSGQAIVPAAASAFTGSIGAVGCETTHRMPPGRLLVHARVFIDATELGDLLPLTGCRWTIGSEGSDAFGEEHAVAGSAAPTAEQSCTWVAALVRELSAQPVGPAPPRYEQWRDSQPFSLDLDGDGAGGDGDGDGDDNGESSSTHRYRMFVDGPDGRPPFWEYRRVRRRGLEAAVVNWAGNDYRGSGLVAAPERANREARELTHAFVHWLRTEVPRDPLDGEGPWRTGAGYPELRLAPEISGTTDGLAHAPYVRESRRLANPIPITWHDIRLRRSPLPAPAVSDSVGVAWYHADLHPRVGHPRSVFAATAPFQIPAHALVPTTGTGPPNLVMGAKNLAATQVAAAAFRTHPGEWAIGEAAGVIAVTAAHRMVDARRVLDDHALFGLVLKTLWERGVPVSWESDDTLALPTSSPIEETHDA